MHSLLCRRELAREKPTGATFIQDIRVIVGGFREQARPYKTSASRHIESGALQNPAYMPINPE